MKNLHQHKVAKEISYCFKAKICGMKETENILNVAAFYPDYIGVILYEKSPRYFEGVIPVISSSIKKVGVFVNEKIENITSKVNLHDLQAIQLHGNESPNFCQTLRKLVGKRIEIIKAFSVGEDFDFRITELFESSCDYFLFDTKGKAHGGNGEKFDWRILSNYKSTKPFFLSGGIGVEDIGEIQTLFDEKLPIYGIDFNSKLEIRPGLKDITLAEQAIADLKTISKKK